MRKPDNLLYSEIFCLNCFDIPELEGKYVMLIKKKIRRIKEPTCSGMNLANMNRKEKRN